MLRYRYIDYFIIITRDADAYLLLLICCRYVIFMMRALLPLPLLLLLYLFFFFFSLRHYADIFDAIIIIIIIITLLFISTDDYYSALFIIITTLRHYAIITITPLFRHYYHYAYCYAMPLRLLRHFHCAIIIIDATLLLSRRYFDDIALPLLMMRHAIDASFDA